jgi:hypothetical protein
MTTRKKTNNKLRKQTPPNSFSILNEKMRKCDNKTKNASVSKKKCGLRSNKSMKQNNNKVLFTERYGSFAKILHRLYIILISDIHTPIK